MPQQTVTCQFLGGTLHGTTHVLKTDRNGRPAPYVKQKALSYPAAPPSEIETQTYRLVSTFETEAGDLHALYLRNPDGEEALFRLLKEADWEDSPENLRKTRADTRSDAQHLSVALREVLGALERFTEAVNPEDTPLPKSTVLRVKEAPGIARHALRVHGHLFTHTDTEDHE